MARPPFQRLQVYQLSERVADVMWGVVMGGSAFDRDTVGKQLVRAAECIGANVAEGYGRGSDLDSRRFVRIARGSMNETILTSSAVPTVVSRSPPTRPRPSSPCSTTSAPNSTPT